jgi:hypothetical protein
MLDLDFEDNLLTLVPIPCIIEYITDRPTNALSCMFLLLFTMALFFSFLPKHVGAIVESKRNIQLSAFVGLSFI